MEKFFSITLNGILLASRAKKAESFFSRLLGLMFKEKMDAFDALWITHCRSIHTCFMKYAIDVVFIDNQNRVVKVIYNIKPYRMTGIYFKADSVIEFRAGTIKNIKAGDRLEMICLN